MVARKKKRRDFGGEAIRDARALVGTGATLGIGTQIVQRTGGPTGGLQTFAQFQPVVGTAVGAKTTLNALKTFQPTNKRKKRSRKFRTLVL